MANKTVLVVRGKVHWCKVLGEPRMNTFTEEREWSLDLTPDHDSRKALKSLGISDKLKTPKGNDKREDTFITFRQREYRTDAKSGERTKQKPVSVVDVQGNPWPQDKEIGNGSTVDVKFTLADYGRGKPKGIYISAVRVLDLVEYERNDFAPLSSDDEFFAASGNEFAAEDSKGHAPEADELDDEIPF